MPELDGIEAARRILLERSVPILLLTAYSDAKLVERAGRAGVFAYLVKPFRANELMPAIATAVARHQEMNALREEAATLADALAARKSIERAKGLLMKHEDLTEGEAFARLRRASQVSRQPLKVIADTIVAALD
jgi:response regulator NasT